MAHILPSLPLSKVEDEENPPLHSSAGGCEEVAKARKVWTSNINYPQITKTIHNPHSINV